MLDACAELVDEVGYEGLTTTLLAERAEVAIGSVYQFFPDKRAIVQALTLRTMESYLQRLDERFASDDLTHWWDGVDAGIDEYISMHRTVPGFRPYASATSSTCTARRAAGCGAILTGWPRLSSGSATDGAAPVIRVGIGGRLVDQAGVPTSADGVAVLARRRH
jgi:AcrR family transcriptional regulator